MKRKKIKIVIITLVLLAVLLVVPASTVIAEVPGVPTGLWVAPHEEGSVTLSWSEPIDDGGSDITGYRIYRGVMEDGLSILEDVTEMLYTDTGLQNGQTYYYAVSALNAEGESEKTEVLSATPEAEAPHMTEIVIADYTIFTIIYVGEGVYFDIADGTYTLVVESVTATSVTIIDSWVPQSFTMSKGDSKNIDVNGDGKDDFKITCVTITSEPAEGFPQTVEFSFTTGSFGPGSGTTPGFELWTFVIAGLMVFSIVYIFKHRR